MQLDRRTVIRHLEHIYCEGEFGEVVLDKDFSVVAATVDKQLFLQAPGLAGVEKLPKKIGVPSLQLLIKVLKSSVADEEHVSFDYIKAEDKSERIQVEREPGRFMSLLCANPRVIGTTLAAKTSEGVMAAIGDGVEAPLPKSVVDDVLNGVSMLNAERVFIRIKGNEGFMIVGDYLANYAQTPFEFDAEIAGGDFEVMLDAHKFTSVLMQVTDYTQSALIITGPHPGMVAVREAPGYLYILATMIDED